MIYMKSASGEVFAYESQDECDKFSPGGLSAMTSEEVEAHLNPPAKQLSREEVSELRRLAYADPLTGSDPLYIEYQRAIAMNDPADQIEAAKAAWLDRAAAIALQYPWP